MLKKIELAALKGIAQRLFGRFVSPVELAVAANAVQAYLAYSHGHLTVSGAIVKGLTLLAALGFKTLILRVEGYILALAAELQKQNAAA